MGAKELCGNVAKDGANQGCKGEIIFPWPPKELSPNARLHWSKKSKAAALYRNTCHLLTLEAGLREIDWGGDIHVWIDFYPPDRRQRDDDNMIAAFKSGRDGMAEALGVNDKRFRTHPYVQDKIGGMVKVRLTKGPEFAKT
jgi:crossover junction endodeoxyribonuclease RusA